VAKTKVRVDVNEAEMARFRRAVGLGMLNFAHAVEAGAKREAPVRGGYRSFLTTKRTKAGASGAVAIGADNGSVLIGGTLRRSIHSVVYVDGKPVSGSGQADENGKTVPDYAPEKGILAVVGTNCEYGAYVEIGTVKMASRPFLGPSFDAETGRLETLVRAGMKRGGY
jgi:hypothetical protein